MQEKGKNNQFTKPPDVHVSSKQHKVTWPKHASKRNGGGTTPENGSFLLVHFTPEMMLHLSKEFKRILPHRIHRTSYKHKPSGSLTSMVGVLEPSGIVDLHPPAHQMGYLSSFLCSKLLAWYSDAQPATRLFQMRCGHPCLDFGAFTQVPSIGFRVVNPTPGWTSTSTLHFWVFAFIHVYLFAIGMVGKDKKWWKHMRPCWFSSLAICLAPAQQCCRQVWSQCLVVSTRQGAYWARIPNRQETVVLYSNRYNLGPVSPSMGLWSPENHKKNILDLPSESSMAVYGMDLISSIHPNPSVLQQLHCQVFQRRPWQQYLIFWLQPSASAGPNLGWSAFVQSSSSSSSSWTS